MRRALAAGGGRMAQFAHPEFGGFGQWMQGGMVMTASGRDTALELRIDRLCEDLRREVPADDAGHGMKPDEAVAATKASARAGTVSRPAPTGTDPFVALDKLAELHARGVLTDGEFATKKAELLARI